MTSHRPTRQRHRILLLTEATFPYVFGGVSSWCHLVVGGLPEFTWLILPIHAGGRRPDQLFELPAHARLAGRVDVWCERQASGRGGRRLRAARPELPAELARSLIGWSVDPDAFVDTLVWCRRNPRALRPTFRSAAAWERFVATLHDIRDERHADTSPPPELDAVDAADLYQRLYWVARAAAVATPAADVLHATAAGWAAIPALVHQRLHGTPLLLTEHGVYVREAYLAGVRSAAGAGERFLASRLARGLSLAAYASADVVAPVTEANARWELGLGVEPESIRVIHNGVVQSGACHDSPGEQRVVSVGRIDPLKDVQTMLHVAADVTRRVPQARFEYWGAPTAGQATYARACEELRCQLSLGDRFRFMGSTRRPEQVVRSADVVLMTSISEGLPMAILEAMAEGRAVVATGVGGVPDVLRGCGIVVPSGDVAGLANGVTLLLRDRDLATRLGRRAYRRVHDHYAQRTFLRRYRLLLAELTARAPAAATA